MMTYLIKNYYRYYKRLIKKNIKLILLSIVVLVPTLALGIDVFNRIVTVEPQIIYLILLAYCVGKFFQDIPFITMPYRLIELKLISPNQVKRLILLKSIYSSFVILNVLILFAPFSQQIDFKQVVSLLLINVSINLSSFFINQTNRPYIFKIMTISLMLIIYYFKSVAVGSLYVLMLIVRLFHKKTIINYEETLQYAKLYSDIFNGISNDDIDGVVQLQSSITKLKPTKYEILYPHYESKWFWQLKELARLVNHKNKLINSYLAIMIFCFCYRILALDSFFLSLSLVVGTISVLDSILNQLNVYDLKSNVQILFINFSLQEQLKNKLLIHFLLYSVPLTVLSFTLGGGFLKIMMTTLLSLLLPLKNILKYYTKERSKKLIHLAINLITVFLILGVSIL